MNASTPILTLFLAAALSLLLTPIVRIVAIRRGFVDHPDRQRKLHRDAVALGGGIAILIAIWIAIGFAAILGHEFLELLGGRFGSLIGLFVASVLIVALGLFDDRYGIRGRHKLAGQIVIALVLVGFGYRISGFTLFDVHVELGLLGVPVTIGWMLMAINALNLIDGIDGLASSVGLILSVALAWMAFLNGHFVEAFLLSALAGGVLGFLRYNFPPAKMFLGDAGSMLIGLWLGANSLQAAVKGPAAVGLAAPLAVWTVPLLDTFAAIARRKLTGRSIYATDRGHLHHCLEQIAGSQRRALYLVVLACSATCIGALASVSMKSDLFALAGAISVIAVLVATRSFGYGELQLVTAKLQGLLQSLVPFRGVQAAVVKQEAVRFQGSQPWEDFWRALLTFTEEYNLSKLSLDVNIPSCHENYHVSWARPVEPEAAPQWETKIPLCFGERALGRLVVGGSHDGFSTCRLVARLLDALQAVETRFQDVIGRDLNQSADAIDSGASGELEEAASYLSSDAPLDNRHSQTLVTG